MSHHRVHIRVPADRPQVTSPRRPRAGIASRQFVQLLLLALLLFGGIAEDWSFLAKPVEAASAGVRPSAPASMTFQQFLKQGKPGPGQRGPFVFPRTGPHMPFSSKEQLPANSHLPPSAEPATMQPIHQTLDAPFLASGAGVKPLDLTSSDHRLEVQVTPGSLDLSQAKTSTGAAASGSLILNISQIHGHFAGAVSLLGSYQLQVTDAQGHPLQGIRLRTPVTFVYHYQPAELTALNLNPDHLLLTWPDLAYAARQAHQPITDFIIALHNDPKAHTLTGQSQVLSPGPLDVGGGSPDNQSPPKPHLASVQGNSGQLSYSYPLVVAPGPPGTMPTLALNYSSSNTNERHSRTSPADNVGEGWTLSMGSITADVYPGTSAGVGTWYFISGVDNVSDRLVPDSSGTSFLTEHISQLRVRQITSSFGQPCFNVWDTAGNFYQFGCTTDSLQYRTDSTGRQNYRWDLNSVTPANEGPGTDNRHITISYLQDIATNNGYTTIRDAALKQITYGGSSVAGTVDFFYRGPFNITPWVTAYGTNYNCSNPPAATTLRCDDPLNYTGGLNAPTVISTFTLQTVKTYVGDDSSSSHLDYSYSLGSQETPFSQCWDDYTQIPEYCAGSHLLTSVTPTVYQNGTPHQLKGLTLGYTSPLTDNYYDSTHTIQNGTQQYNIQTYWDYLNSYYDSSTGVGGSVAYQQAYNNTHGTPYDSSNGDDRHDPMYCSTHSDCSGTFAWPDDRSWSVQTVLSIKTSGKDSSASGLGQATTTYHYRLAVTGSSCPADSTGDTDCVGDNWTPKGNTGNTDGDWMDYYHSEFRGFNVVYTTSPAGDVTADTYASTEGWTTYEGNSGNLTAGHLYEEDVYSGSATSGTLLSKTVNIYAGNNATPNPCNGNYSGVYPPCEVMVTSSRTTRYERTGSGNTNAPWVQHDYTYDDYNSGGLAAGYHNTLQEVTSSANAPTVTRKWTYKPTDTTVNGWVYYNVHKVTHSEVDDANNHVWHCQDTTYDEGAASGVPTPDAGLPTTVKTYTNCADPNTALTGYAGYDVNGNALASVDGVGAANPAFYSSAGCTLASGNTITIHNSAWTSTHYTSCSNYDAAHFYALPVSTANALGQSTSTAYDPTQGDLPTSITDLNGQSISYSYSYDSSGNPTVQDTEPLHSGSYTTQSRTISSCTTSSTLPCLESDKNTNQYSSAITRTFYDSMGRAVETRTPGPGANYDTIVFTVYNDQAHTAFQSVPFQVASGSGWVDPNGATDYQGITPGGTVTFYDALGRPVAEQDPNYGSSQEPGLACSIYLSGTYTACTNYYLGTAAGDTNTYASTTVVDANNHVTKSFADALGRTVYIQYYSGLNGQTLTSNEQKSIQYNALDKPTQIVVKDEVRQSGQSITSVTTTAQYDDLGRETQVNDPDRGIHTYSYDADGRLLSDVAGSHTLGYNDDLLGRVGCVQDAAPTLNASGACSAGNPLVQNTYDTTELGTQGSSDFPVGHLTKSEAKTYFPEGTSATATQKFQYDQRGRAITSQLSLGLPGAWNVTTALPTYQLAVSYNDADQVTTTSTSTIPSGQGYTTTQAYDNTGAPYGLSNNSSSTPNLATLLYNARAQLDTINMQTSTGSALDAEQFGYDANLRVTSMTTSWQSGSGNTGTIFAQNSSYDNAGNVISLSTTQVAVPGQNGSGGSETQNFCYDEQNRLVWAGNSGTQPAAGNGTCGSGTLSSGLNGASYANSYVYTHLGQLWQGPLNGGSTQYQYLYCNSQPHELSGLYASGSTCTSKSGQGYATSYDAFGNVTSRTYNNTTATLSYDTQDHLTEWNAGASSQEWYLYDAGGQRVLRRSINSTGTSLTVYAFGLEEHVYSSTGSNQGNTYYYTLGGHLLGASDGQSGTFYQTDLQGSVVADWSNTAGSAALKGNEVYGPYGKERYNAGTHGTSKGFTGQYGDWVSGLDYYNVRYYDPKAGVFLSADTVQGNVQGMDPYAYVGGNPETKNDPSGQYIVGANGETYHPGSSYYTQGGAAYSVQTGQLYNSNGFSNGWRPGYGAYAAGSWMTTLVPYQPGFTPAASPSHFTPAAPPPHFTPARSNGASGAPSPASTCDPTGSQAICGHYGVNYSLQLSIGGEIAMPGDFCIGGCSRGGDLGGFEGGSSGDISEEGLPDDLKDSADMCGGGLSFTRTTKVATAQGEQAIGTMHPGEKVKAYNPKTHQMELESVLHVWINHDNDLVDLTLTTITPATHSKPAVKTGEVIHTNQKHPFLTREKGFLPVGQIKLGMHVLRADGRYGVVTGWKVVPGTQVMYNLTVAQDHTFTVGVGQWVVHNCPPSTSGGGGEIVTNHPDAQSAFNHAMSELGGSLSEDAQLTQAKGLGGDTSVEGLYNGMREGRRSWRLDYDPEKGPHFNWELGKKSSGGIWGAATFPGTYEDYIDVLLKYNEGGVDAMFGP